VSEFERKTEFVETIDDGSLIREFRRGHEWAFDRLMDQHTDRLFSVAWGVLRNRDDALDIVQEVFVRMYGALDKFKPTDNLNAWLYRVCLNLCIDRKRRLKHYTVTDLTSDEWDRLYGDSREQPEFRAAQSESGRAIWEAVDRLPKRQQMAFVLRHHNLLSVNEVAATLGCSVGAVKAHLSRATASLRTALSGVIFETPGGQEK